ncbi:hypothetical protein HK102_003077 [Quaeritorhiza haematococci]|nr:hypothetical protein HK102_003077 [Quaeritorhiza haematococci]
MEKKLGSCQQLIDATKAESRNTIDLLEDTVHMLKSTIADFNSTIKDRDATISSLQTDIKSLASRNESLATQLHAREEAIHHINSKLAQERRKVRYYMQSREAMATKASEGSKTNATIECDRDVFKKELGDVIKKEGRVYVACDDSNKEKEQRQMCLAAYWDMSLKTPTTCLLECKYLLSGTGKVQAEGFVSILKEYNIDFQHVSGIVMDNACSQFGDKKGCYVELQKLLGKPLEGVGCDLHILQIMINTFINTIAGPRGDMSTKHPIQLVYKVAFLFDHFPSELKHAWETLGIFTGIKFVKPPLPIDTRWLSTNKVIKWYLPIRDKISEFSRLQYNQLNTTTNPLEVDIWTQIHVWAKDPEVIAQLMAIDITCGYLCSQQQWAESPDLNEFPMEFKEPIAVLCAAKRSDEEIDAFRESVCNGIRAAINKLDEYSVSDSPKDVELIQKTESEINKKWFDFDMPFVWNNEIKEDQFREYTQRVFKGELSSIEVEVRSEQKDPSWLDQDAMEEHYPKLFMWAKREVFIIPIANFTVESWFSYYGIHISAGMSEQKARNIMWWIVNVKHNARTLHQDRLENGYFHTHATTNKRKRTGNRPTRDETLRDVQRDHIRLDKSISSDPSIIRGMRKRSLKRAHNINKQVEQQKQDKIDTERRRKEASNHKQKTFDDVAKKEEASQREKKEKARLKQSDLAKVVSFLQNRLKELQASADQAPFQAGSHDQKAMVNCKSKKKDDIGKTHKKGLNMKRDQRRARERQRRV